MTDVHLREAERRFRATGCPEDEAELLRVRLRLGLLRRERLAVAAYAGHGASRALLGPDAPAPFSTAGLLEAWQHAEWTDVARQVGQPVAVSAAEAALRVVFTGRTRAWLTSWQQALLLAQLHLARGALAGERVAAAVGPRGLQRWFRPGPAWHCARAAMDLVDAAQSARTYPRHTGDALRAAGSAAASLDMADPAAVDAAARAVLVRHALDPGQVAADATGVRGGLLLCP